MDRKTRPDPGSRANRPARPSDFPTDVQSFVKDQLTPMLSDEEKDHLRHEPAKTVGPNLPIPSSICPKNIPLLPPLPAGADRALRSAACGSQVRTAAGAAEEAKIVGRSAEKSGKWPQYALAAADLMKQEKRTPPPLGASRPADFSAEVRDFIGKLTEADQGKRAKRNAVGRITRWRCWMRDGATNQAVPGMSLPGPRELWDSARTALPDLPDRVLSAFAGTELSASAGQPEPSRRRRRGKA